MKAGTYDLVQITPEGKIIAAHNYVDARGKLSYFDLTGTNLSITTASDGTDNFVHLNPVTVSEGLEMFDNNGVDDGHLRYTGRDTKYFQIDSSISITPVTSNDSFVFALAVNDAVVNSSRVIFKSRTNTDVDTISLHDTFELSEGDTVCVFVANTTGTDDINVKSLMLMVNE